ncbi:GTPase domain-containing protein [Streptosporangium sp. KLBMP 9127]|nr:GTPase domain-containing protein [Streptosporangium sp. KLBMP 9127]
MAEHDTPLLPVMTLGTEGAGKTVYLAMLYKALFADYARRGYVISTHLHVAQTLNFLAQEVNKPGLDWPESTSSIHRDLDFSCRVSIGGEQIEVLRLRFYDYPGELLRDARTRAELGDELDERVASAHAIIVMLDGREILALLRGEPRGEEYVNQSLVPIIQQAQRPRCPMQVVLTKWDLLADAGYTLREVRDRLIEVNIFRGLLYDRLSKSGKNRLIPLSAVGRDVVELREAPDGSERMVKRQGRELNPINIDVPLAVILPDRVEQAMALLSPTTLRKLERKLARMRRRRTRKGIHLFGRTFFESTAEPLTEAIFLRFLDAPTAKFVTTLVVSAFRAGSAQRATDPEGDTPESDADEEQSSAMSAQAAFVRTLAPHSEQVMRLLMDAFDRRVQRFENDCPGWDLAEGLADWERRDQEVNLS